MELIYILISNLLVLFVIYFTGSLLLYPHRYLIKDSNPYSILFHKLFLGVTGSITLFSLYCTYFLSINLIFLLMYILICVYSISEKKISWNIDFSNFFSDIKKLPYFLPVLLIAITVALFKNYYFLPGNYFAGHDDNSYYVQLARFMPVTHCENVLPWNTFITTSKDSSFILAPYHYGDLWLTSFCIQLCPFLLPMISYNFVLTPVMITLTGAALTCLIQSLLPPDIKLSRFLIAFIGFLFAMYWGYTPKVPLGFIYTVSIEHKIFNFIFPVSYSVFCYLQNKKTISFIALSSVIILDFVYFPVLLAGLGLMAVFLLQRKNRTQLKYFLIPLLFGIYILLFYYVKGSLDAVENNQPGVDPFSLDYIKSSFLIIAGAILKHLVTCFPFYLVLFFIFRNLHLIDSKIKHITVFIIAIVISSLLLVGFGHLHREFWQFIRPLNSLTSLLLLLFLTISYNNIPIVSKRMYLFLFSITTLQALFAVVSQSTQAINIKAGNNFVISKNTVNNISDFLNGDGESIAYYAHDTTHSVGVSNSDYNFSGFLKKNISFFEINLPSEVAPNSSAQQTANLKSSSFYEYMQTLKQANHFTGLEDAQLKFLKEQHISYVLLSNANSPEIFKNLVFDSLLFDTKPLKLYKLDLKAI